MDKILAFIKEAKWFSISIGIFMVIWLGPKLLEKIEENKIESEREKARAKFALEARNEKAQTLSKNKIINKEYLGFVCNRLNEDFEIKFILEKYDGNFVSSKTFYLEKVDGRDKKIVTLESRGTSRDYHKFFERDETIKFNINGEYSYHSLLDAMLTLDRTDLSFVIEKTGYDRMKINGYCKKIDYEVLLKEQTEHNLKIKENNVL
jgi:hypothetical protein